MAKALFFDVFGTLVDWRTGIAREAETVLEPLGSRSTGSAFADAWRDEYQPAMDEVRSGRIPFSKLDVLHRRTLDASCRASAFEPPDEVAHNLNLAWHRLDAWPDVPPAWCGSADLLARAGLERQHLTHGRSCAPQRSSLGRNPRRGDRR